MNEITVNPEKSVIARFANNYGVDQSKVLTTLKNTCFKIKDGEVTNEQMMSLLIVAEQHKLNPFTREIYAFPDKKNGIVPVVGVDGWASIINRKSSFNGMDFNESENMIEIDGGKRCPEWIECVIHDKNREHPVKAKEYLDEVYRPPFEGTGKNGPYKIDGPWQTHTKRMLRHKAMIQCARIAYGFSGIYDLDEAERIIEGQFVPEKEIIDYEIREGLLEQSIIEIQDILDSDTLDKETSDKMTFIWDGLNNSERLAVSDHFDKEIPGHTHHKKYKSLIKEYLDYVPSHEVGNA